MKTSENNKYINFQSKIEKITVCSCFLLIGYLLIFGLVHELSSDINEIIKKIMIFLYGILSLINMGLSFFNCIILLGLFPFIKKYTPKRIILKILIASLPVMYYLILSQFNLEAFIALIKTFMNMMIKYRTY